jgi:hypothetical protein
MQNKSFYAHHSAFGAFSSFMVGKTGMGGGFVLSDVRPPQDNILIGYKQDGNIKLLPFLKLPDSSAEQEFTGEAAGRKRDKEVSLFTEDEISREMGWASDIGLPAP